MNPGPSCVIVAVLAVAGILAVRSRAAEEPHRRRGLLAAALGVSAFAPALLGPTFGDADVGAALAGCGVLTIALAVLAVGVSVGAARARPVGGRSPLAGFLLGGLNLACGSGLLVVGLGMLSPVGGTPRTWRSDEFGFEVTVPTERWEQRDNPRVFAEFGCRRPALVGCVAQTFPAATDEAFEAVVRREKAKSELSPLADVSDRTGPNAHGRPHWLRTGRGRSEDGNYLFGASVTRVGDAAVLLLFEGPYRMSSAVERAREARALAEQAELFLGSVR